MAWGTSPTRDQTCTLCSEQKSDILTTGLLGSPLASLKKSFIWLCQVLVSAHACFLRGAGGARTLYLWHWLSSCSPWAQLLLSVWDLSSLTRAGTHVPCIGRRILYQWTTRVVPPVRFLKYIECLLYCGSHWEGCKYTLECCPFNHNRCSSSYTTHTVSPRGGRSKLFSLIE